MRLPADRRHGDGARRRVRVASWELGYGDFHLVADLATLARAGWTDSSAIVQGIVEGTISWTKDPDFGYMTAESVPGIDDVEILQPRKLYERLGRLEDYAAIAARLQAERASYLSGYEALDDSVARGLL